MPLRNAPLRGDKILCNSHSSQAIFCPPFGKFSLVAQFGQAKAPSPSPSSAGPTNFVCSVRQRVTSIEQQVAVRQRSGARLTTVPVLGAFLGAFCGSGQGARLATVPVLGVVLGWCRGGVEPGGGVWAATWMRVGLFSACSWHGGMTALLAPQFVGNRTVARVRTVSIIQFGVKDKMTVGEPPVSRGGVA